jgi:squalene-hopene/tetraprenyl-beta-curcumene cyclase
MTTPLDEAVAAAAEALFVRQREDGMFVFDSSAAATMATAGAATALYFADRERSAPLIERGVDWIARTQAEDGGWAEIPGGPTEIVPTSVAAATLELLAPDRHRETADRGRRRLAELGGIAAVSDPLVAGLCRLFDVLAGREAESALPRVPIEVLLLPGLRLRRISFRAAPFAASALAQAARRPAPPLLRPLRPAARRAALRVLYEVYEREGRTGEYSAAPWVTGLVCIGLARAAEAPDLVAAIVDRLRSTVGPDGAWDLVDIGLTWTAFAATGLIDAGYATDARLKATRELIHATRQREPFPLFGCPAGGWSYSGLRGWPVTLESAELLSALAGLAEADHTDDPHLRGGIAWLTGRQDKRGSWSLWVKDTKLSNDGPCAYITCQAVHVLLETGVAPTDPRVARALRWLLTQQRPDGSYVTPWYRDSTAGTAMVLTTLGRAGMADHPVAGRARDWLLGTQLADGSWGTGDGSTPGTVEETAWALRALLTPAPAHPPVQAAAARAADWLLSAQRPDGSWPEASVSAYVRRCVHYPNGAITIGLALRALSAYRDAKAAAP